MKKTFWVIVALFCNSLLARDDAFIRAYDARKYSEAASLIEHVNVSNIEVTRRLGVMYYEGRGITSNQAKGLELLEDAMEKGCVQSAINLVKIYFRIEKNTPKASRCLLEAEKCNNEAFKDEIEKLKTLLGPQYKEGLATYIQQLRGMLKEEQRKLSNGNLELQHKMEHRKMTPRKSASYYKRLIEELDVNYEAISIDKEIVSRDEIYQRYNELARKHNKLVQKYNRLIKAIDDEAVQEKESDDNLL